MEAAEEDSKEAKAVDEKPLPESLRKKIFADLKKARDLTGPREVAAYFGARADVSDGTLEEKKEAAEQQKEMDKRRKRLATVALLKSDVRLHNSKLKASRRSLTESRRWEETRGKPYKKQESALLMAEKRYGLALEALNAQLEESPFDISLLNRQLELYEKLGIDARWSDRVRLQMKMRENRVALPQ
ncbi:MAG: hypothetical protein AAF514_18545 [Verrucomicrobiota bacterium]